MSDVILGLEGVTKNFGGLAAVDRVDLEVTRGQVHSVVGPNGAGKTTLFNLVSGFENVDSGRITLDGRDVTAAPVHRRVPLGMVRTFQNIRLFHGMTVYENVLVGQHAQVRPGLRSLWPRRSSAETERRQRADEIIELFQLSAYRDRLASGLPYGVQKRLELARAVAGEPSLLMLDEPTAGMNEEESAQILDEILTLRGQGVTVVLVEHDMNVVMGASDIVTVLNFGQVIAEGTPQAVQEDPVVREAYLGEPTG